LNGKKLFKNGCPKGVHIINSLKLRRQNMTTYNIPHAWSVGFDSVFDRLERLNSQQPSYPPHNVVRTGDESFRIEVAVAGLSQEDLDIEQDENVLTISSDGRADTETMFIHKGIANRKFKKQFTLGEYIEVSDVTLVNGILTITLRKNIPEEKMPKKFAINTNPQLLTE
jgi:molecular chaperone IbpA